MPEWFSSITCIDKIHHVPDVVNLAIGVNLLFPVASSFLRCFLDGLEVDPKKIVERYLDNQAATSSELEEIAVAALAIEVERSKCSPLAWGWWLMDFLVACAGVLLLLTGWVDSIGLLCLLLFLPACLAVGLSVRKYKKLRKDFLDAIARVKTQITTRQKCDSPFVKDFVKKCQTTIKQNRGRKKSAGQS